MIQTNNKYSATHIVVILLCWIVAAKVITASCLTVELLPDTSLSKTSRLDSEMIQSESLFGISSLLNFL